MRSCHVLPISLMLVLSAGACSSSTEQQTPPTGSIRGVVTYTGPLPCSERGHVVGNLVIALYDVHELPSPTGLGLAPNAIGIVPGDALFESKRNDIPKNDDGSRACPVETPVEAGINFEIAGLAAGRYQARAWFDYDGDWQSKSYANGPTKGDIAGGFITNMTYALAGAPIEYGSIEIGTQGDNGTYTMPESGFVQNGVVLTLGLPVHLNRPYFHIHTMTAAGGAEASLPVENPTDADMVMPSDHRPYDANTMRVEQSLYRVTLQSGLPETEVQVAMNPPYYFRLGDPLYAQQHDANHDGIVDGNDHIVGTSLPVRAMGPTIRLDKMTEQGGLDTQSAPRVLMDLVVLPEGTDSLLGLLAVTDSDTPMPMQFVTGLVRPSAVCIEDPRDPSSKTIIVATHAQDLQDPPTPIIADEHATVVDTAEQLGRDVQSTELVYGCLPPGKYAFNATYPWTGQTWRIPNESGDQLASQNRTFEVGPASSPEYCQSMRKPLEEPDPIRDICLTAQERQRYIDGTLWGGDPNPLD